MDKPDKSFTERLDHQENLDEASAMVGATDADERRREVMTGGGTGRAPGIPTGDRDAGDVTHARETARGGLGGSTAGLPESDIDAPDSGAPWDQLDEGLRLPPSDPTGPDKTSMDNDE